MVIEKKYSKYAFLFLGAVLLALGFYAYNMYQENQAISDEVVENFEEKIPLACESGEWIVFPDSADVKTLDKKFAGNAKLKYLEKEGAFANQDGSRAFTTNDDYSLSFFVDRDVRMEGYELIGNEIYVQKIKCVGKEADKIIQDQRQKLMNYISQNINSLALEKSEKSAWQVETFYFADDTDLYVQYESEGSFVEDLPYDSRLWLIRATKLERNAPLIETLAYIQEDADDPEKNIIKQGEDLYRDVKNLTIYEFDDDANRWILQ